MEKEDLKKSGNAYLKYTGIAFQMAGIILASIFIGLKLDEYVGTAQPYITALLVLLTFSAFMYKLYVELMKK